MPPSKPSHIVLLFLDGIGVGIDDPAVNPLSISYPGLLKLSSGARWTRPFSPVARQEAVFLQLDATLGLPGLPQSGTGQVALFTGTNAPELAGKHFGPYPHSKTRDALRTQSIFAHVADLHGPDSVCFANAYPPRFFQFLDRFTRWPVTTRACMDAGIRLRTLEDLAAGDALAADVTGDGLRQLIGDSVDVCSPSEAATNLNQLAVRHRLTVFEVFHSDKAGHAQDHQRAAHIMQNLAEMCDVLLDIRGHNTLVVMSSDHGNLEDLSTKTHTRNPVPFAAIGPGAQWFQQAALLTDVAPVIKDLLS